MFLCILFTALISIARQKNIFIFFWIWWLIWIDAVLYSTLITSYSACKLQLQIPNSCRVRSSLTCVAFFNRCTLLRRAFRLSICHFANLLLGNTNWVIMQVMFLILMTQSGVLYIKSIQKGLHKFSWKQLPATVAVKLVFYFVARKFNCSKWSAWLKPRHFNLRLFKCAGRRKRGASGEEDEDAGCSAACRSCRAGLVIFVFRTNQVWIEVKLFAEHAAWTQKHMDFHLLYVDLQWFTMIYIC